MQSLHADFSCSSFSLTVSFPPHVPGLRKEGGRGHREQVSCGLLLCRRRGACTSRLGWFPARLRCVFILTQWITGFKRFEKESSFFFSFLRQGLPSEGRQPGRPLCRRRSSGTGVRGRSGAVRGRSGPFGGRSGPSGGPLLNRVAFPRPSSGVAFRRPGVACLGAFLCPPERCAAAGGCRCGLSKGPVLFGGPAPGGRLGPPRTPGVLQCAEQALRIWGDLCTFPWATPASGDHAVRSGRTPVSPEGSRNAVRRAGRGRVPGSPTASGRGTSSGRRGGRHCPLWLPGSWVGRRPSGPGCALRGPPALCVTCSRQGGDSWAFPGSSTMKLDFFPKKKYSHGYDM